MYWDPKIRYRDPPLNFLERSWKSFFPHETWQYSTKMARFVSHPKNSVGEGEGEEALHTFSISVPVGRGWLKSNMCSLSPCYQYIGSRAASVAEDE